jgi:hypothetical protein
MALGVAVAWGYVAREAAKGADHHLDRVLAMLSKLGHQRSRRGAVAVAATAVTGLPLDSEKLL